MVNSLPPPLPQYKHTVNPLLKPSVGLFILSPFGGGGGGGGLFNLETMTVSVLLKELAYKVEKLKYKKVGGHAPKDQNQIRTSVGK